MACRLTPVPDSSDFEGPAGEEVTVATHHHIGEVLIAKAEYAGAPLVPPDQAVARVSFTILGGRHTLKLVFVFTASVSGRGELREEAGADSQFMRSVAGDEPLQIVRIIGT